MKLLQRSQYQLLVLEHANCIVRLHGDFDRSESRVDSHAARVDNLTDEGVLLNAMLHCVCVVVITLRVELVTELQVCLTLHNLLLSVNEKMVNFRLVS